MANFTKLSIIKFFELVLVCVLLGLHYHSFNISLAIFSAMLTMGTLGGYLIILVGVFMGNLMGTPINRRVDLFFSLVGFALFIIVGALNIEAFRNMAYNSSFRDIGLAKGSICIFQSALLLVDSYFTLRGEA